jgi:hypothetical protein
MPINDDTMITIKTFSTFIRYPAPEQFINPCL